MRSVEVKSNAVTGRFAKSPDGNQLQFDNGAAAISHTGGQESPIQWLVRAGPVMRYTIRTTKANGPKFVFSASRDDPKEESGTFWFIG